MSGQCTRNFIDSRRSYGNYLIDTQGNTVLDFNASATGQVLGHNNCQLATLHNGKLNSKLVATEQRFDKLSNEYLTDVIRENVMEAAPVGLKQVHLTKGSCSTGANEAAISVALQAVAKRNGKQASDYFVLGFDNSHHGKSKVTLSASSDAANTSNQETLNWPKAPFPQLRFPIAENEHYNIAEEDRCLQEVERIIHSKGSWGSVGAIIVEPISTINNQIATPRFYRGLRKLALNHGLPFIVDETKTGIGASGKNWAYEYWYLHDDQAPDFVTFGGKAGISGFYSNLEYRLNSEATSFSDQVNLVALLNYGQIWRVIAQENLLHLQKDTSSFLKIEIDRMARETGYISTTRGYGTHLAFDSDHAGLLHRWLLKTGINIRMCGPKTFALRPSLTLGVYDAAQLRESLKYYSPNHE